MNTVIVPNVTLPEVCHATFADPAPIPIPHHVPARDEWLRPSAKQKRILVVLSNYICTATNYSPGPPREVQQVRQGGVGLLNQSSSP
jgi:hypothetical protein